MGIKILRMTDRVPVKIGGVVFQIGPLSYSQKSIIQDLGYENGPDGAMKKKALDVNKMIYLSVKYCVKGIDGLETLDGKGYQVEFEDGNQAALTDNCVEDVLNLPMKNGLSIALMQIMNGYPDDGKIYNPERPSEILNGIEILVPGKKANAGRK